MSDRSADIAASVVIVAMCGLAGWLYTDTAMSLAVGAAFGVIAAAVVLWLRVRPLASIAVIAATATGVLVGKSIVRVLCLPNECIGLETTAAVLTGIGAFVGVGLVVALVMRSFDEYRTAQDPHAGGTPPTRP